MKSTFRELNMDFLVGAKHNFGNLGVDLTGWGKQNGSEIRQDGDKC